MTQPGAIGVLSPLVVGPYFGAIIEGVAAAARAVGRPVVAIQTHDVGGIDTAITAPDQVPPVAWDWLDGAVVIVDASQPRFLQALRLAGKPLVTISEEIPGLACPVIRSGNRVGVQQAVSHLVEHGHRRIAFIGNLGQDDIRERHAAYRDALRRHGITPDESLFFDTGDNMEEGGARAGEQMLRDRMPATATVAGTDLNAIGLMRTLRSAGISLPADHAVIGFDDVSQAEQFDPALTTIAQPVDRIGTRAAEVLADILAGNPVQRRYSLPTTLIVRESCGCQGPAHLTGDTAVDLADPQWLAHGLLDVYGGTHTTLLDSERILVRECAEQLRKGVLAAAGDGLSMGTDLRAVADQLYYLSPRRESINGILATVQRFGRAALAKAGEGHGRDGALDSFIRDLAVALGESRSRRQFEANDILQNTLRSDYAISMDLLRGQHDEPKSLRWLAKTGVSAGCVALWRDRFPLLTPIPDEDAGPTPYDVPDRDLEIAGSFGLRQVDTAVGQLLGVRQFPPRALLDIATVDAGSVVFVLPVRTPDRDWGLLSVVGHPHAASPSGLDTYFQWAAMLSVSLDREEMLTSLQEQREDLERAYHRERRLAEEIQVSEERYALAAHATNDGLWDWDVESMSIYFSDRCRTLLGLPPGTSVGSPDTLINLIHPDDAERAAAAVNSGLSGAANSFEVEWRIQTESGNYRWVLARALSVPGGGRPASRMVGSLTDINDRKELEEQLRRQALYDGLTGLPNRMLFIDRLGQAIARRRRQEGYDFAVLFLDLDGFKIVNDSLGHLAGDDLLITVAQRISSTLRSVDTAARFGGDEFAVLLDNIPDEASLQATANRLHETIAAPYVVAGTDVFVTATIGIAPSGRSYDAAEDLVRDADIAMYRAKSREPGSHETYDASMRDRALSRLRTEAELRHALEAEQLELFYQPIVALPDRSIVSFEALVRWRHPDRGLIPPDEFLPVAHETGLILPLGEWVLTEAIRQLTEWRSQGLVTPSVSIGVNVSNREFWHGNLPGRIADAIASAGLDAGSLTVEITEGVIMGNTDAARSVLDHLHELGVHVHVDDFGTGWSSLEALHRFSVDALKIDRSFVWRLESDHKGRELVRTIVMMGGNLGLEVVAEGVETIEQEQLLREFGCRLAQGYRYAKPLPATGATLLLSEALTKRAG